MEQIKATFTYASWMQKKVGKVHVFAWKHPFIFFGLIVGAVLLPFIVRNLLQ